MVPRPTARRPLIASLALGLRMGLFVASALAPSETSAASALEIKEGGTLIVGSRGMDFIDPALTQSFNSGTTIGLVSQGLEDATCALLFRYPVSPPPLVRYDLVPEVATGYPELSYDGKTYTFTIR